MHQADSTPAATRLASLDAFRGMTILGMILVNNPGNWSVRYAPLAHAEWHGWTLTDLVFPFFLFIMGTALAYSTSRYRDGAPVDRHVYRRIVQRSLVLILLGLGLNLAKDGLTWMLRYADVVDFDFDRLRLTGVLQRIGLTYLALSVIVLNLGVRGQAVVAGATLAAVAAAYQWLPDPNDRTANLSPEGNFGRVVDVTLIGQNHMRDQGLREPSDPTGLFGTIPSIASALAGYWAGLVLRRRLKPLQTVAWLAGAGAAAALAGLALDGMLPINKKLWTSSYVLLCAGLASVALAGFYWLIDVRGWRRSGAALQVVGVNAIVAYVGSELTSVVLNTVRVDDTSLKSWIYRHGFVDNFADERNASLAFALGIVAVWWLVAWVMARRGWTIRA